VGAFDEGVLFRPRRAEHFARPISGRHAGSARLRAEGIPMTEFPQTQANCVRMGETLFGLIKDRRLIAYRSEELREHILNATATETPQGGQDDEGQGVAQN
jgi:hypothetical protein